MAWRGLMETDAWNELTASEKQTIENTINNYKANNLNQICTE
ncbi:hypothetical protein KORDIASMS9_04538 [Kordia sp. SMS9]|nr:hypothetical protein [Kordia sp. SMS9]AXG72269.1 hypothetical protein KORDIASMS9_04538 [Kordia sp. SMS9]